MTAPIVKKQPSFSLPRGLMITIASLLAVGILFWLAMSRQIIRPLERLAIFSQEVGVGGEYSAEAHRAALTRRRIPHSKGILELSGPSSELAQNEHMLAAYLEL